MPCTKGLKTGLTMPLIPYNPTGIFDGSSLKATAFKNVSAAHGFL